MKKTPEKYHIVCILADAAAVVLSMAAAFWLRFRLFSGYNPVGGFYYHMLWAAVFSLVFVLLYALFGVYTPHPERSYIHECGRLVLCNTIGVMLYIDVIFVFRVVDFSRWMILMFYLILNVLTGTRGFALHRWLRQQYRNGKYRKKLLILGSGRAAEDCATRIRDGKTSAYEIIGTVGTRPVADLPLLGDYSEVQVILESGIADETLIAVDEQDVKLLPTLLRQSENTGVKLALLPICYEYISERPFFEDIANLPIINIRRVPLDNFGLAFVKRTLDIFGSLALIVLTSPLMIFAAVGTRLSSPGPILFRQERIGKDKKPFSMLKFRSMHVNDESDTAWTEDHDPRRTKFGAWMRRYSVDELPQLFNVLKGDMSLVGPRPEIPAYVEHFKYSVPLYLVRHRVRPGITGWAQVNGLRGNTSIISRVDYDLYYIENWSFLFDLKILLMTPLKGIVNRQESLR